ncbi:MAG TPA: HAMP domain-containing sensor histidine kinase [Baekduia sp.]|uniref:sensor histidine kinase n=1 Tax=Baekduia sp. TaxID=2600305 RepID=UPI002D77EFAE|nr:HAMP domain-containing sensor histidine kinase [Baekduia sp.]HET6510283.1 HAMP domain-containing sensor histidine kinase [Baekduia sp.]
MSFRNRILLTSLVILAAGLGALVVAGNVLLDVRVHSEASSELRTQAEAVLATIDVRDGRVTVRATPTEASLDRHAWVLEGATVIEQPDVVGDALDTAAIDLGRRQAFGEHDGPHDVALRAEPIVAPGRAEPIGAVVVALSTEGLETLQQQVVVGSLVVALLVLVAGGLALRRAIDRALAPVVAMTDAAETWGAQDLDQRFGLGPPRDELTGLAATLDGLLARIAASRRHEQRFAAEVAHELRTPLAGVMGRAELALDASGPEADAEREAALRVVIAQGRRLTETVDTLLAVARRELDPGAGSVDLEALAHEVPGARVTVPEGGVPAAEGDPDVLRRALAPLVDNARRHAASAITLELSSVPGHVRLAVRDDGPGVDAALGERVFEPGVSGAGGGGAGLGLPLARRLARSCGGDVVLAGDGPGGCFVLDLPVALSAGPRATPPPAPR